MGIRLPLNGYRFSWFSQLARQHRNKKVSQNDRNCELLVFRLQFECMWVMCGVCTLDCCDFPPPFYHWNSILQYIPFHFLFLLQKSTQNDFLLSSHLVSSTFRLSSPLCLILSLLFHRIESTLWLFRVLFACFSPIFLPKSLHFPYKFSSSYSVWSLFETLFNFNWVSAI